MTFGEQVKDIRRRRHMTQAEMAGALGLKSLQTVSNWECERSTPWPAQQDRILQQIASLDVPAGKRERPRVSDDI